MILGELSFLLDGIRFECRELAPEIFSASKDGKPCRMAEFMAAAEVDYWRKNTETGLENTGVRRKA